MDYRYINLGTVVTIEDIYRVTEKGHVVNAEVGKPSIGNHSLLIEEVTRTENGDDVTYHATFYHPYDDEKK